LFRYVSGSNIVVNYSYVWLLDVHLLLDIENFHFSGIEASIHAVFVYFALKIRSGGKATPEALIHLIAVIYSCLLLIFLNTIVSDLFISTFKGKVVLRAKLVLLILKIALEG
jgi:hypothetical protein